MVLDAQLPFTSCRAFLHALYFMQSHEVDVVMAQKRTNQCQRFDPCALWLPQVLRVVAVQTGDIELFRISQMHMGKPHTVLGWFLPRLFRVVGFYKPAFQHTSGRPVLSFNQMLSCKRQRVAHACPCQLGQQVVVWRCMARHHAKRDARRSSTGLRGNIQDFDLPTTVGQGACAGGTCNARPNDDTTLVSFHRFEKNQAAGGGT